jgi:WD40 repeat protein/tRNA A-37 threonylcarbamoyl transferase component Bud32
VSLETISLEPGTGAGLPARFGDYELLEEIARGGMGVVYKARQLSLNRIVAVKMILTGQLASGADVKRFRAEAEAAANLQHPNIVAIHEIGQHDGQHFFSMDYVEGQNLAEFIGQKPLPPKEAANYLKTIAEAIHYAHNHGILHRDLKPSNILIDPSGQPRVTDFGLARQMKGDSDLTVSGQVLGSPNFMPPEQATGKRGQLGPHSDVYALGAILFYMLTARPPFAGESMTETLHLVVNTEPPSPRLLSPGMPRDLETICLKCLSKEPQRRYANAGELADELGHFLRDEPILARPMGKVGKTWRWCRRNPLVASFAGATALLLLALAIGSPIAAFRINRARQATETALGESTKQQRLAAEQELLARRRFYAAQINLAGQAAEADDLARCIELLETQRPEPGKEDLRTFEWYHLWDVCHAWHYLTLKGHGRSRSIFALAFSPDGRTLVSGSYGEFRLWDIVSGKEKAAVNYPPPGIFSTFAFTPDGDTLISGSWDGIIRLWDASTAHLRAIIPAHESYVSGMCITLSPDGKALASGGTDGILKLWNTGSWDERTKTFLGPAPVTALAYSSDGTTLASEIGHGEKGVGKVSLWDVTQMTPSERLKLPEARTLAFSPDGKMLATSPWQSIQLWDTTTGELRTTLKGHQPPVGAVLFLPNGALASCATDRTVRLWLLAPTNENRSVESILLGAHRAPVLCLAAALDGKLLASGANDGTIELWNVAQSSDEARSRNSSHFQLRSVVPGDYLSSLQLLPDGKTLVAFTKRGTAGWNTLSGRDCLELAAPGEHGALSPNGELLARGGSDGTVALWDFRRGKLLNSVTGHVSRVCATTFSPDGRMLVSCAYEDATIRAWDVSGLLKPLWARRLEGIGTTALAFAPDGKTVAAANRHRPISFLDSSTGSASNVRTAQPVGFHDVSALAYSPDGRSLASGGEEGTVKLWHSLTGTLFRELRGHSATIRAIAYSPDGRTIATGSDDGTVRLWDPVTGQERMTFKGFNPSAMAVAFSSDGMLFAAASANGLVRIWRMHRAPESVPIAPQRPHSVNVALEEIPLVLKALEQSKTNLPYEAYNALAWYCVTAPKEIQSPEHALPLALAAVELSKTNQSVLNTLGVVYYRLGRFTNAVEIFERNIRQENGVVTECDRLFLAMSYQRLGQRDKAKASFDKATKWLEQNPSELGAEMKEFLAEAENVLDKVKSR